MARSASGPALLEQLTRWTELGLIDAGQAAGIEAAEASRAASPQPASPQPAPRRQPLVVEALGYLGAVLAVVAGLIAARQLWPHVPAGTELACAAVAAIVLLVAGALLQTRDQPPLGRLRSVLWLLSAGSLAAAVGLLTGHHFGNLALTSSLLVTEAVATAYAAVLWWRFRRALQHLAVFGGTVALIGTAIAREWPGVMPWGFGAALWALSLLWGIAVWRGRLVPLAAGYVAAAVGLLAGAQTAMGPPAGVVLAVATVAGLLAAGVALREVLLLGFGAVGTIVILPEVATRYLPSRVGAAVAVLAVGLIMLGVALWLARTRQRAGPAEG
jgi:hypothetical protein